MSQRTVLVAVLLSFSVTAAAQIIELRNEGGKQITCMRSGLSSDVKDCGTPEWYAYVFVGSISSVTPIQADEKEVQITPQEIFRGTPPSLLTVRTSQALCGPPLVSGDRWLFFLRVEPGKPIILDPYANDSAPVANAEEELQTLRRLQNIGPNAIVRGHVMQGNWGERKPIASVRVLARTSQDIPFSATTDAEGRFEFPPLPAAKYTFTTDPIGSFRATNRNLELKPGTCQVLTLTQAAKLQRALIRGQIKHPDGSVATNVDVLLLDTTRTIWSTTRTDDQGHFYFDSLHPGEYLVGTDETGQASWRDRGGAGGDLPVASLYYPGTRDRSTASIIKLGEDEKRNDVDFVVLPK